MKPHYVPSKAPPWFMQFRDLGSRMSRSPGPLSPVEMVGTKDGWWTLANTNVPRETK